MQLGIVESILAGRSREYLDESDPTKVWQSGISKEIMHERIWVSRTGIHGDEQADLVHHGGIDKAVLAYSFSHYAYWQAEFPTIAWRNGSFGENLAIAGLDERGCCIGDVMQIGNCLLQVSQPRQPCWKLSKYHHEPRLAVHVQKSRKTGWYYRVLKEGEIAAGASVILIDRPHPSLTVRWSSDVMYSHPRNPSDDLKLASCPSLSQSWQMTLGSRAQKSVNSAESRRLYG